ncbi:MAG: caspase family protein [Candidatus Eremiobacterota bacterium]
MHVRKLTLTVLIALALGLAAGAGEPGRKWAVVVGVNDYKSETITPLRYAEADAKAFAAALEKSVGFPAENIFLFTTDQTGTSAPTRANLAARFDQLMRAMGPNDTLVIYFSGHGVEREGQSFLLTCETDARTAVTLRQTALKAQDLFGWVASSRANQVLLVVDACRNDPIQGSRGMDPNPLSPALARDLTLLGGPQAVPQATPPTYATLFACSSGQRSFESAEKGHGFFTYYLVQGLEGKAAGPNGVVTLQSLVNYVQREVTDAAAAGALQPQTPWLRYEGPGADNWQLAMGSSGTTVLSAPRPAVALDCSEVRVSQEPGSPFTSLRSALKQVPYGGRIVLAPGTYHENVDILRGVEIVGEAPGVVIHGVVTSIAPATLRNLTVRGQVDHKERFTFDRVQFEMDQEERRDEDTGVPFHPSLCR